MKKDLIFTPILLIVAAALFFFRYTGTPAHIIISIVGLALLVAYTILSKKNWKIPALEIIMRAFYGIALISGVIIMNVQGILALAILHKASAVIFVVLLIALLVSKLVSSKKA